MLELKDLMDAVDGTVFEFEPVDLHTFINSPDYLNMPKVRLSEVQEQLIKASTQIYFRKTLHFLYGFEEGERQWTETFNEIIFQLGKGGGKDFSSEIACAYLVYKLLCLTSPSEYFGKPPNDEIAIINVAINAAQANNVFFKGFKKLINQAPWFRGKYSDSKAGEIAFDKYITVFSGHSERESFEGYNTFMVVLDEIAGFAVESTSGNEQAKTAQSIYDTYRGSVISRFPDTGKLVLLSFPRYKGDFIQTRYEDVIAEKQVIEMSHTLKLDPDLPDGVEGNEFEVHWDQDHITRYNTPRVFAIKRTSWESNPTKHIQDYTLAFFDNMIDALSRFACMPPLAVDAFFKDKQKVDDAFRGVNGVDDEGRFTPEFLPIDNKEYFIHVDLARKHDHCAVSMAHVERWEQRQIGGNLTEPSAVVKVDCVRWWTPTAENNVDFTDVKEYIIALKRRGFDVKLVTFDRWESDDLIKELREYGLKSENLSVAKKHYTDMAMVVHEGRLSGPNIALLKDELLRLRIMPNDKIDHPRSGSKDLADATCGAIFNAIAHTRRDDNDEIVIKTLFSITKEFEATQNEVPLEPVYDKSVIRAPKKMPDDLMEFLEGMRVIGNA